MSSFEKMCRGVGEEMADRVHSLRDRSWVEVADCHVDTAHMIRVLARYSSILRTQLARAKASEEELKRAAEDRLKETERDHRAMEALRDTNLSGCRCEAVISELEHALFSPKEVAPDPADAILNALGYDPEALRRSEAQREAAQRAVEFVHRWLHSGPDFDFDVMERDAKAILAATMEVQ